MGSQQGPYNPYAQPGPGGLPGGQPATNPNNPNGYASGTYYQPSNYNPGGMGQQPNYQAPQWASNPGAGLFNPPSAQAGIAPQPIGTPPGPFSPGSPGGFPIFGPQQPPPKPGFPGTPGPSQNSPGGFPIFGGPQTPQKPPPGIPPGWVQDPNRMGGVRPWDSQIQGFDPTHYTQGQFYRPAPAIPQPMPRTNF
jgi:hypothetical protein